MLVQARPKALRRVLAHADPESRRGMRWYSRMGRRVWFHEILEAVASWEHTTAGPTLREMWGRQLRQVAHRRRAG